MASDRHMPPAEMLADDEIALLASALGSRIAPAAEASAAGARAWLAFFEIRDAEGRLGRMSISGVVKRAGVARGPFATAGGRFRLLRQAVRDVMVEERPVGVPEADGDADRAGGREAARADSREELRRRLQVSDSHNAAYCARALAAERIAGDEQRKARKYLAELNERDQRDERGEEED